MALSDMTVFNEELYSLIYETTDQLIDKFNAASNGTMTLTNLANRGNYKNIAFWKNLDAAQGRRDVNGSGSLASTSLAQGEWTGVKVAGRFGPVGWDQAQITWIQESPEEALDVISNAVAENILKDQLNTGILSAVAATSNNAAVVNDVSASGKVTQQAINGGLAKFGDKSQMIRALVMTGVQYHELVGQAIANSNNLFEIGGVAVREGAAFGQGRPIIVTDAPALREAGSPDKQKVLGLVGGAIQIEDNQDFFSNIQTNNGSENIGRTFQAEYTFNTQLLGYSWNTGAGGASPPDAALGTGTNWPKVFDYDKNTLGVQIIGQE